MSIAYGQQALTPGTPTVYNVPMNSSGVVVQNESPYTLNCSIDGTGNSKTIAAQSIDMVAIPYGSPFSGNIILSPLVVLDNSSQAPSYAVLLDAYGQGEAPAGTYPVALNRLVQVGGTVNTAMGSSTSVQNDNNPAGTSVVEATQSGSPQSNLLLDNSGNMTLRQYVAGVLTTLMQVIAGASGGASNVLLGDAAHQVEVMGNFKVDGAAFMGAAQFFGLLNVDSIKTNGATTLQLGDASHLVETLDGLQVDGTLTTNSLMPRAGGNVRLGNAVVGDVLNTQQSTGDVWLKSPTTLTFQVPTTTTVMSMTASQINTAVPLQIGANSAIKLLSGSLTRIGVFTGGPGNATITHNWGVVPDIVMPTYIGYGFTPIPGGPPTGGPMYISNVSTTTIAVGSPDSAYHWQVLAIKF